MLCNQTTYKGLSHRHKCDKCMTIWEHSNGMAGNDEAHKCPKCGKEEWCKYFGSGRVCFIQEIKSGLIINHKT